jgi:hypothetical protein
VRALRTATPDGSRRCGLASCDPKSIHDSKKNHNRATQPGNRTLRIASGIQRGTFR